MINPMSVNNAFVWLKYIDAHVFQSEEGFKLDLILNDFT